MSTHNYSQHSSTMLKVKLQHELQPQHGGRALVARLTPRTPVHLDAVARGLAGVRTPPLWCTMPPTPPAALAGASAHRVCCITNSTSFSRSGLVAEHETKSTGESSCRGRHGRGA